MPDNEQEVKEKIATRLKEFGLTRFDDGAYRESAAGIYQLVLSSLPGELTLTKNPAPCYAAPLGTCPTLNKDCQDCEREVQLAADIKATAALQAKLEEANKMIEELEGELKDLEELDRSERLWELK